MSFLIGWIVRQSVLPGSHDSKPVLTPGCIAAAHRLRVSGITLGPFGPVDSGRAEGQTQPISQESSLRTNDVPAYKFQPLCTNPLMLFPCCFLDTQRRLHRHRCVTGFLGCGEELLRR